MKLCQTVFLDPVTVNGEKLEKKLYKKRQNF